MLILFNDIQYVSFWICCCFFSAFVYFSNVFWKPTHKYGFNFMMRYTISIFVPFVVVGIVEHPSKFNCDAWKCFHFIKFNRIKYHRIWERGSLGVYKSISMYGCFFLLSERKTIEDWRKSGKKNAFSMCPENIHRLQYIMQLLWVASTNCCLPAS